MVKPQTHLEKGLKGQILSLGSVLGWKRKVDWRFGLCRNGELTFIHGVSGGSTSPGNGLCMGLGTLCAWPQQGLATLRSHANYQWSGKHVLIHTPFLLIVPFFLQTGFNSSFLIVWVGTVSKCHLYTFIICHRRLLYTVVQLYTMEGVQKLNRQNHIGIHRACLCCGKHTLKPASS